MTDAIHSRAERFHALHTTGDVLVLPNAWDAASARVFEQAGFPAIGTSSAAMAWSLGFPDGQRLGHDDLFAVVGRLTRVVRVPVTVDIERGFGDTPAAVGQTVRGVVAAGGVGINLEDGLADVALVVERIQAARAAAAAAGVPLFINARTDLYLRPVADPAARFPEAVRRLAAYALAGADGVFAPGIADPDEIARLVQAVPRPLNVYAGEGVPPVPALARAGVRRVSVGCGPMQAALGLVRRMAAELRATGTYAAMTDGALSYGEANGLFVA